jgi:MFS family permease
MLFLDPGERIKALGIWGGIAGLGGTSGTVISGVITDLLTWRWIFLINLPVAAFALLVVPGLVSESKMVRAHKRIDWLGAVAITAGLVSIVYGVLAAGRADHTWTSAIVIIPIVAGAALVVFFVWWEGYADDPLIPLRFFANRTRVVTNGVTLFFASAFFTYFFLLTLFMQQVLQYSALKGGLVYLPFGLAIGAGIGLGTGFMPRVGVKVLMTAGFAIAGVGMLLTSGIDVDTSYASGIMPGMIVLGFGSGLCFPAFGNASLHQVTGQDAGLASGVQNAMQQIAGALGLATLATLALRHASAQVHDGVAAPVALTDGYVLAYRVSAVLLFAGAVAVALLLEHVDAVPRNPDAEALAEPAVAD